MSYEVIIDGESHAMSNSFEEAVCILNKEENDFDEEFGAERPYTNSGVALQVAKSIPNKDKTGMPYLIKPTPKWQSIQERLKRADELEAELEQWKANFGHAMDTANDIYEQKLELSAELERLKTEAERSKVNTGRGESIMSEEAFRQAAEIEANTPIHAPFTAEQVESLNEFQKNGVSHPFTCTCGNVMHAEERGWKCADHGYVQFWAHEFAANGSWKKVSESKGK